MTCPYCGARNRARAPFCRRCQAALPPPPPGSFDAARWGMGLAFVLLVALFGVGGYLLGRQINHHDHAAAPPLAATPTPTSTPAPRPRRTPEPAPSPTPKPTRTAPPTMTPPPSATPRPAPSPTPTSFPTSVATVAVPSPIAPTATVRPAPTRAVTNVATEEARVRAAVIASNTAWMRAMQSASAGGLARIKTDPNLQSVLADVATLQRYHEYWRIRLGHARVLWGRLLTRNHAQALLRKFDELRVLYRQGRAAPLEVDRATYYDLYDLERVQGRWLISRVSLVDDATGARLTAVPPRGL